MFLEAFFFSPCNINVTYLNKKKRKGHLNTFTVVNQVLYLLDIIHQEKREIWKAFVEIKGIEAQN